MDEEALRGDRPRRRSDSPKEPSHDRSPEHDADPGLSALDRPVIDRYMVQLFVDRDLADSIARFLLTRLQLEPDPPAQADSTDCRPRVPLRDDLIQQIRSLQASGELPVPMPRINPEVEKERFDRIWQMALLDRSWRRLEALQKRVGLPFHLTLRQRSEAPGLSITELAFRLSRALDRPVSEENVRFYLRRAGSEFARILLEEVIITLPDGSSYDAIERELIELNLLAYCLDSVGELRKSNQPGRLRKRRGNPPRSGERTTEE